MIKLFIVIGARPQIIKAAAVSRAVKAHFQGVIKEKILVSTQIKVQNSFMPMLQSIFWKEL